MQIFFDDVGMEVTDSTVTFPDGTVWDEDETTCGDDAEAGQIVLARWNSAEAAANGERPSELITDVSATCVPERPRVPRLCSSPTASTRSRRGPTSSSREQPHRRHRPDRRRRRRSRRPARPRPPRRRPPATLHLRRPPRFEASMRCRPVGGFGTRLRPLTLTIPKPMLPVVDRPIVEWVIAGLAAAGVDEAVLALGFRARRVPGRRIPTTSAPGPACATRWSLSRWTRRAPSGSRRPGPASGSGSSADRRCAHRSRCPRRARRLPRRSRRRGHHRPPPGRRSVVVLRRGAHGTRRPVLAFVEKPPPGEAPTDLINAGTYVLEPSVLERSRRTAG